MNYMQIVRSLTASDLKDPVRQPTGDIDDDDGRHQPRGLPRPHLSTATASTAGGPCGAPLRRVAGGPASPLQLCDVSGQRKAIGRVRLFVHLSDCLEHLLNQPVMSIETKFTDRNLETPTKLLSLDRDQDQHLSLENS